MAFRSGLEQARERLQALSDEDLMRMAAGGNGRPAMLRLLQDIRVVVGEVPPPRLWFDSLAKPAA